VWGAINPETGVSYLYHKYYRSQAEPVIHAAGIKAVGDWIPGVEDPSCLGSTPVDGRSTMEMLTDLGLDVQPAVNAVETGLYEVWGALSTGHLKVFDTLPTGRASSASTTATRRAASSRRTTVSWMRCGTGG
jgi:hypothetical protein